MFEAYERDPFKTLSASDWVRVRELLSDGKRCFPGFSARIDDRDPRTGQPRPFPSGQWSQVEIELLIAATVVEPVVWETGSTSVVPSCRLSHVVEGPAAKPGLVLACTDLPTERRDRVFPWSDEARAVLRYLASAEGPVPTPPERVLSAFCGSGTVGVALAQAWPRAQVVCADISPRALKYVHFNALLNRLDAGKGQHLEWVESDVLDAVDGRFDLIVATPPFALQPPGEEHLEHPHSAGGADGLAQARRFWSRCRDYLRPGGRVVALSYGLGTGDGGRQPLSLCKMLDEALPDGGWSVRHLAGEKTWRIGDDKTFSNPMPVHFMVSRLADPTYRARREGTAERWEEWILDDLVGTRGLTHLHYVVVDYRPA